MKNEKGITLITLILYVILMTFVVALISAVSSSFYASVNEFDHESESAVAFSKFNMYFVNDIKRDDVSIVENTDTYIVLSYPAEDGNTEEVVEYSVQNRALYRNKVKICDDVEEISISVKEDKIIEINIKIGVYAKTTTYVIE